MKIEVVRQILEWNEDRSREIRAELMEKKVCLINLMGSPGAGKTSLLTALIERMKKDFRIGVIEGDIAGKIDAEKIDSLGIPVVQLNTDGACHIEAMSISHILPLFELDKLDVIFIENIGNLVCPAEFDLGEDLSIAALSVPEGDDKAEKYPLLFANAGAVVLTKYDTMPYFDFDDKRVEGVVRGINPHAAFFRVSSKTGLGMDELIAWLNCKIQDKIQ